MFCINDFNIKRFVHQSILKYKCKARREFYKIDINYAINLVNRYVHNVNFPLYIDLNDDSTGFYEITISKNNIANICVH